jgi:dipeptidase
MALLGMDLVRLVVERAASAEQGVAILTALLEAHGQGGPAGYRDRKFVYDNSFILADPEDAWVVETAGRAWAARRIRGIRAISNGLTLRDDWDRAASGIGALARDYKLDPGKGRLDFARTFGDPLLTRAAAAVDRRACNESYLGTRRGAIGVLDAMAALRQHGRRPGRGMFASVCAHAAWWPTRRACQTTSSLVAELGTSERVSWLTATAAPCTSLFKPIWLDAGLPDFGPTPRDHADPRALWWRHERLHRRALADLPGFVAAFAPVRDAIEAKLVRRADELRTAPASERLELSRAAIVEGDALDARFVAALPERAPRGTLDRLFWRAIDRQSA